MLEAFFSKSGYLAEANSTQKAIRFSIVIFFFVSEYFKMLFQVLVSSVISSSGKPIALASRCRLIADFGCLSG
jgi:hypothetical protein